MNDADAIKLRNKNRRSLILMVLVFLMPMLVAWFVLKNIDTLQPKESTNFGELVQPAKPLNEFSLIKGVDEKFTLEQIKGMWNIFYFSASDCNQICKDTLSKIHQARLGQGKEMRRVKLNYINIDGGPLVEAAQQYVDTMKEINTIHGDAVEVKNIISQFEAVGKSPHDPGRIFLIDPLGNIMMTYTQEFVVRDLLKDMERLLKYSQIG